MTVWRTVCKDEHVHPTLLLAIRLIDPLATYNMRLGLKYTPKSHPSEQILHAFSDHQDFILLVCTVTLFPKIIFNSSYTEKINYFLLYELIQDLPYSDMLFMNSSPDNQYLICEMKVKSVRHLPYLVYFPGQGK